MEKVAPPIATGSMAGVWMSDYIRLRTDNKDSAMPLVRLAEYHKSLKNGYYTGFQKQMFDSLALSLREEKKYKPAVGKHRDNGRVRFARTDNCKETIYIPLVIFKNKETRKKNIESGRRTVIIDRTKRFTDVQFTSENVIVVEADKVRHTAGRELPERVAE